MKNIILNDQNTMPQLGFGLWLVNDEQTEISVAEAFDVGYRSIDSAQIYKNESGLGRAIKNANIPREEMFITTKIWNENQGRELTLKSFDESMKKLGLEKLDLLLIHWPSPRRKLYLETWKTLIQLKQEGRVNSIGVSNFMKEHLEVIINETSVIPVINQIELHPHFQQKDLRDFHLKHGIQTESWSPLGQGKILDDPKINEIAKKYSKTPAQVILRWHIDQNLITIPKSVTPHRIKENFQIFDFHLNQDDLSVIQSLDDKNGRIGPHPETADF